MTDLPAPDEQLAAQSQQLCDCLRQRMAGGALSFADYMRAALYEPGLGYYAGGLRKFGKGGDFVTAPELSPLFARCIARQAQQVLGGGDILEFGAGSGALAAELLLELDILGCLPRRYCILEVSAGLRDTQRKTIEQRAAHLLPRVEWLNAWPTSFCGFAIANEVLDAMPVERFRWRGGSAEQSFVAFDETGLHEVFKPADAALVGFIEPIRNDLKIDWPDGFVSEVNAVLSPWFRSFAKSAESVALLLLDYGYPRREYYHPSRSAGTLRCYYRHRAHENPFFYPGLQDITAHVDFTAVAEAGTAAGMVLEGFTSQRQFLLNCGLAQIAESAMEAADEKHRFALSQQVQKLTLPAHMGETFNAIGFSKNLPEAMIGFALGDQAHRL